MKAGEARLLSLIKKSPQFIIPIYQRTYSWTERECKQLWDDIKRTGSDENISAHFVGSIVYIQKGLYQVSDNSPLLVIDGQQRLTTLTLLLAALAKSIEKLPDDQQEPFEGFTPRKLRNYYLVNPEESGEKHHKLILSQTDKDSLISLIMQRDLPKDYSVRVSANFKNFEKWITEHIADLPIICKGISKLLVVDIALSRNEDNPQLIFESMNSTGRELTQADLIRNYILMGLEPDLQEELYVKYWRPIELDFGQEAYNTHFDSFMRHYLTVKTGIIPNKNAVYDAFKLHSRSPKIAEAGVDSLVADIRQYASYFCAMALGSEPDHDLNSAFFDLRELKVDVAYPFLLELYHDYSADVLSKEDFQSAVRLVEAYVFRRAISNIPTNSLNKTFSTFGKALKKDRYLESIHAHLLLLPSYRRFPNNEEFKREFQVRDLYHIRSRSYWLRRFENFNRKERVVVSEYTIEHILPQNDSLPEVWKDALGEDWQRVKDTWLHTAGNLTLTGYNSEYSDRSYNEKRNMVGGFKESPIKLNQGLGQLDRWNEDTIKDRAKRLAKTAVTVWKSPDLDSDVLDAYRPTTNSTTDYTIEDHTFLLNGLPQELFQALKKAVLALDPVIHEEILKQYVAYKAETNFVDVIPQVKRLRLSINVPFVDISDPRGLCRNVKDVGRWGNGEVEASFESIDDLPYIMGFIRQALERQMGNGSWDFFSK